MTEAPAFERGGLRWWEAAGYVVLAVAATMGVQTAGAGLVALIRDVHFTEAAARFAYDPALIAASQFLGFGIALVAASRRMRGEDGMIHVHIRLSGRMMLWASVAGIGLQLPLAEIGNVVSEFTGHNIEHQLELRRMLEPRSLGRGLAVAIAFIVMAPIMEEGLFRGVLLPSMERTHGRVIALLVSSFFFAIIHGRPAPAAYAFAAGLILGAIRLRTGTVIPCMVLHAWTNAVPVLIPHRLLAVPGMNVVSEHVTHVPLTWLLPSVAIAAIGLIGLARAQPLPNTHL